MKRFKKIIFIVLPLVLIIAFFLFSYFKKEKPEYLTVVLERNDLKQSVSEIGTVKASQELALSFSQVGQLKELYVAVGDLVEEGQVLAELDYGSWLIKRDEAQAALNIAQINQDKLIKGALPEDIAVLESQLRQAESAYRSAQVDLDQSKKIVSENRRQAEKTLNDLRASESEVPMPIKQAIKIAETNLDNTKKNGQQTINNSKELLLSSLDYNLSVLRSSLDSVQRIVSDEDIKHVFSVQNYVYKTEVFNLYQQAIDHWPEIESKVRALRSNSDNIEEVSNHLLSSLQDTFYLLEVCFYALENTITSFDFTQITLDNFKNIINTNKNQINASISNLQNSNFNYSNSILAYHTNLSSAQDALRQAQVNLSDAISKAEDNLRLIIVSGEQQTSLAEGRLDSAQKAYDLARINLNRLKTPANIDDRKLAQSQLDQAMSNLEMIEKQIEENQIKAPIVGQVTKINYEIGEQISGLDPVISLLTENNFEIEIYVAESDISKLEINNEALITFDALDDDYQLLGRVYFIEPAATSISDVIYYKVKIELDLSDSDFSLIKSGMTANVDIITNFKKQVFTLPLRAVLSRDNGDRYVRVLESKDLKEVSVQVGLSGDQGLVEVISNELQEGDLIVTLIKNNGS
ncbi:MAG: HlyD family efflux transporter periplasmic adaptor subunit [Patescibacteria group bacterium]|nr:HlyD family efflux transporter periplasmic adaptor subunit [Patescibacteria group bacterium]